MANIDWSFSLASVAATVASLPENARFHYPLRHGTMKVGLYAPRGVDDQSPHQQDELYIIVSGTGTFSNGGERRPFKSQDVIFVAANVEHRFENFSDDFATWVIFWGPQGGENPG